MSFFIHNSYPSGHAGYFAAVSYLYELLLCLSHHVSLSPAHSDFFAECHAILSKWTPLRKHFKDPPAIQALYTFQNSSKNVDPGEKKIEGTSEKYWASGTGFGTGENELQIETPHWSQSIQMSLKEKRDARIAILLRSTVVVLNYLEQYLREADQVAEVAPSYMYQINLLCRLMYSSPLLKIIVSYLHTGYNFKYVSSMVLIFL